MASERVRERFVIFRPGNADTPLTGVVLDEMMTDLVHEHVEEHEVAKRRARPANDALRTARDAFDHRPGTSQARFSVFRQPARDEPRRYSLRGEKNLTGHDQSAER